MMALTPAFMRLWWPLLDAYETMERIAEESPRLKARIAGVFYLLTFLTGGAALFVRGRLGFAAGLIAGACYIAVTLLFYYLFKPVNRSLSLLAAFLSLVGCAIGPLSLFVRAASRINPLVFFGFYCLLIGYLIFRSTFLPRIHLSPYIFAPGILGEGALTLWLLVVGVNEQGWKEQASAAGAIHT